MFCNICRTKTDAALCPECEALVKRRVQQFEEAMPVLAFSIGSGTLYNHQRDVALLRECDERPA